MDEITELHEQMHPGQKHIVETVSKAVRTFEGSINALKEVARLQGILRSIENVTNSDREHDADYSAVCDKVNALAREALFSTK